MQRTVTRAELARELRRIEREGTERLVSYQLTGDDVVIMTEPRVVPPQETR